MPRTRSDDLWERIVDSGSFPLDEWMSSFNGILPYNLADRFRKSLGDEPPAQGTYSDRIGLVFFTSADGYTEPLGVLNCTDSCAGAGGFQFIYHPESRISVSETLPNSGAHGGAPCMYSFPEMPAFFDNLTSEGWKSHAEALSLGQLTQHQYNTVTGKARSLEDRRTAETLFERINSPQQRFERLLTFGRDVHGAVWVVDVDRDPEIHREQMEAVVRASIEGKATITGTQAKLPGVLVDAEQRIYRPTRFDDETRLPELSTHIIKLHSQKFPTIIFDEYLSYVATAALLPEDCTAHAELAYLAVGEDEREPVIAIQRFDRTTDQDNLQARGRMHFEEMNQLLENLSYDRDQGRYADMVRAIARSCHDDPERGYALARQLYERIVAQLILGNVDNHFKNFSLISDEDGVVHLTPNYDLVPAMKYGYNALSLAITNNEKTNANNLGLLNLVLLGRSFGLDIQDIKQSLSVLFSRTSDALQAIRGASLLPHADGVYADRIKGELIDEVEKFRDRLFGRGASQEKIEQTIDGFKPARLDVARPEIVWDENIVALCHSRDRVWEISC